jgi:hypothetical protein
MTALMKNNKVFPHRPRSRSKNAACMSNSENPLKNNLGMKRERPLGLCSEDGGIYRIEH